MIDDLTNEEKNKEYHLQIVSYWKDQLKIEYRYGKYHGNFIIKDKYNKIKSITRYSNGKKHGPHIEIKNGNRIVKIFWYDKEINKEEFKKNKIIERLSGI